MELTEIHIPSIEDSKTLIEVGLHASRVIEKIDSYTQAYGTLTEFPYTKVELMDGLVYLALSKDPSEPVISISPMDWTMAMRAINRFMENSNITDIYTGLLAETVDGKVIVSLSFNLSPQEWTNTIIWLRDVYFPGVKLFAINLRLEAISKASLLLNT
jgi:hypothetical protein